MNINSITTNGSGYNPYFRAYEKTFVMLKPDAFNRKLDSRIIDKFKQSGLSIEKEWEGIAPKSKIENNYINYKSKSFFKDWVDFMTSNKIKAFILAGNDAISKALKLKKEIRSQYAPNEKRYNLVHSSDDVKSAEREIKNFFETKI